MGEKAKILIVIAVSLIIIVALICIGWFVQKENNVKEQLLIDEENRTMTSLEKMVYTRIRLVEAELAYDGITSPFDKDCMDILKKLVKRVNSNNEWFASNSGTFYVDIADTSDREIVLISDGKYTAKFYVKVENSKYILEKYTFSAEKIKGYELWIEY